MVAVGDRLNGKMDDFETSFHEAETEKAKKEKSQNVYQNLSAIPAAGLPPSTMEQWLKTADKQGPEYWRKIKAQGILG